MKKGSLTVFYSMTIMILLSLFLTMVEVVRENAMETASLLYTKEAVESSFSEFNAFMWKNYGMLGMDFGYNGQANDMGMLASKLVDYAKVNSNPEMEGILFGNSSFLRMEPTEAIVDNYGLLTDNGGAPAIVMGARQVIGAIPEAILNEWLAQSGDVSNTKNEDVGSKVSSMNSAKAQAKEEKEAAKREAMEKGEEFIEEEPPLSESEYDDPSSAFGEISSLISQGVLAMVIPDVSSLSTKKLHTNKVSERTRFQGTRNDITSISAAEKVLYGQYLFDKFEYYGHQLKRDGLDYEVEYVIFGKNSDVENLAAMAERLLLIREGQNLISVGLDSALREQAYVLATAVIGWTGNPGLVTIVQIAIMAIWAFIESILDVRTLFAGGRVAFVKNYATWTSTVTHLLQVVDVNFRAKESEAGMNYIDYMRAMLVVESQEKLGLRSLDAIEYAIRTQDGFESVKVDQMIYAMEPTINYYGTPMFLSFVSVKHPDVSTYNFTGTHKISYLD